MLKYMLDTNIVVYTMKNKPASVKESFSRNHGRMCISSVTLMELVYGAERSSNPAYNLRAVESFAARLEVLSLDSAAAHQAGQIRAHLAEKGLPIGPYDQLIAGHARSLGLVLVTNNISEFARVDGLRVENWAV